jgi:hypothetical protein
MHRAIGGVAFDIGGEPLHAVEFRLRHRLGAAWSGKPSSDNGFVMP